MLREELWKEEFNDEDTTKQLHNFLNFSKPTDDALNDFFISTCGVLT